MDRPRIGVTLAKALAQRILVTIETSGPSDAKSFAIPPNNPNWESPPNGETETLLSVAKPFKIPKGTRMKVTAHYDNSANNKFNPDPNQTVYYGDMTWEEMMFPFFSVTVDQSQQTKKVIKIVKGLEGDGA